MKKNDYLEANFVRSADSDVFRTCSSRLHAGFNANGFLTLKHVGEVPQS